ncbi:MAG: DUF3419 family protein [Spirochaetales bacterium]|nr:DUF3419 family protein [Spirochaetales bacterium]
MNTSIEQRASFHFIRYANCWEDADILLEALQGLVGGNYLSIASAGDNSLSLLTHHPAAVVAVDMNPAQIALLELKKLLFKTCDYNEVVSFLGVHPSQNRTRLYNKLRILLGQKSREFFDSNKKLIDTGLVYTGKFERYFTYFRKFILPLILSKSKRNSLIKPRTKNERELFYEKNINTFIYNRICRFFFSRYMMGKLGRDMEFYRFVEGGAAKQIMKRVKIGLTETSTSDNPYLEFILFGKYVKTFPHYLRLQSFDPIKKNIDKLVVFHGSTSDFIKKNPKTNFNGFNLSDIFEYMSEDLFRQEIETLLCSAVSKARLVYWNMLVPRQAHRLFPKKIKPLSQLGRELFLRDKAFFYRDVIVEETL